MKNREIMDPAPAKPSATIVVLRDGSAKPEMLMVKRRAGDAFGESYTFPGGVVEEDESAAAEFCAGVSAAEADAALNVPRDGLDYYSAGIRELFEETGILLARDRSGKWACGKALSADLRSRVDKGLLPWPEFLQQRALQMTCDALHYFAYWETPFDLPKRWTTRFFLSKLPVGQDACHDGYETTDCRWMNADDFLAARSEGEIRIPYPTIKTLESLQHCNTIDELISWAKGQQAEGIGINRPATSKGLKG